MASQDEKDLIEDILRARLRLPEDARLRLAALRHLLLGIDRVNRGLTGQPFFAVRETALLLAQHEGQVGAELMRALLSRDGGTEIRAHGLEHIPATGPLLIGSTHPTGTFDVLAHFGALKDHRPDVKFVAHREAERFLGDERLIAVDLDRRENVLAARQTITAIEEHLHGGGAVLVFGSGRVSDMSAGLLTEPPWRSGLTRISAAHGVPIVPACADLRNSRQYYRTRGLARRFSGNNKDIGRTSASLHYGAEVLNKLGGSFEVHYGAAKPPGTPASTLQAAAEGLVPGLYGPPDT